MDDNGLGAGPSLVEAPGQAEAYRRIAWYVGTRFRIFAALAGLLVIALVYLERLTPAPGGATEPTAPAAFSAWQFRWGDSPRTPGGKLLWAQPGPTDAQWRQIDYLSPLLPGRHSESVVWLRTRLQGPALHDATLYLPWVFQSFQVYLDGQLIYEFGDARPFAAAPGGSQATSRLVIGSKAHFIALGDNASGKLLSLRVHSDRRLLGLAGTLLIGQPVPLLTRIFREEIDRIVIGFLLLLVGLAVLILFLLRREELGYLYYGFFALGAAVVVVSESALRMFLIDSPVGWVYLRYVALYVSPIFLIGYIEHHAGRGPFGLTRWLRLFHSAFFVQAALRMVLFHTAPYDVGNGLFIVATTLSLMYLTVIMAAAAWRGDAEARIFTFGFAIAVSFLLHEALMGLRILAQARVPLIHYGLACLTLALGLVSARRYLLLHTRLRNFTTVMQLSLSSAQVIEPGEQARAALDALVEMLVAQQALLFEIEEDTGQLALHAMHDGSGADGGVGIQFATEVAEKVRLQRRPLLLQLAVTDPSHPRSVMVGPLLVRDQLLGVVYLAADATREPFREQDQEILLNVSGQIAGALLNSRAIRLEFAHALSTRQMQEQEALLTAAGRMAQGDLASPIAVPAQSELVGLAGALDGMRQDIATRIKLLDSTKEALQNKVAALQDSHREVEQLNEELRRQIEQRSRRLLELLVPTAGAAVAPQLEPGVLLGGRYRIVRLIGAGGMGRVYEVERITDGRHLAAKLLSSAPDRTVLGRFAREAQILSRLDHPNLISITDVDITSAGALYIIMELVNGDSLWEHRSRFGQVSWALSVIRQLAQALSVLHAQGIVHRDLKPENVLIVQPTPEATPLVKLSDFGISLLLDDTADLTTPPRPPSSLESAATPVSQVSWGARVASRPLMEREAALTMEADSGPAPGSRAVPPAATPSSFLPTEPAVARGSRVGSRSPQPLTQAGSILGTPQYMAPELARGSHHAQPAADVFSLGVLAYELLTGELPFAQWPIFSHTEGQQPAIVPLRSRCPELLPELAELCGRCLAGNPALRPTAQELAERLAAVAPVPHTVSTSFSIRDIPT